MATLYPDLTTLLRRARPALAQGPLAVVLAEDDVELRSTLSHLDTLGFRSMLVALGPGVTLPEGVPEHLVAAPFEPHAPDAPASVLNPVIAALPSGIWVHYCYNAEFLHFPFCDSRGVAELLAFHAEERRDAMLTYVVDLYADDLRRHPDAVSLERAHFDRIGYYALARADGRERQLDVFGGLRWRFEEHVPPARRRIDRISIFRTRPRLAMRPDHTFGTEEYNTYACPWHNNLTAAVCSFRTAKALKANPASTFDIPSFHWHGSERFRWSPQQLMDLGLMEPGQWF
jgi:hypothetical protein